MAFSIKLNGDDLTTNCVNLGQLLLELKIDPEIVIIEKNQQILAKGGYNKITVEAGDVFEIIRFMGGG